MIIHGKILKNVNQIIKMLNNVYQLIDTLDNDVFSNEQDTLDNDVLINNKDTLSIAIAVYNKSQTYVPVDTGKLKKSGYIEIFDEFVRVGYNCSYAAVVHEVIENHHDLPTKSKYLEDACYDTLAYMQSGNEVPFSFVIGFDNEGGIYADINKIDIKTFEANEYIKIQHDKILSDINNWGGVLGG